MKTLKLLRVLIPLFFINHCASSIKAQSPTEQKKEEYRIKMVKIENGKTVTIDTVFNSKVEFEKFHKQNMEQLGHKDMADLPLNIKIDKNAEKEVIVMNGDTAMKHHMKILKLLSDSTEDVLMFTPKNEEDLKQLHEHLKKLHDSELNEGDLKDFDIQLMENLGDLPEGHQIKMIKVIAFINLEEPTKDELNNNSNAEIKGSVNEKQLAVKELNVYPNPSSGQLNLDFELAEKGKTQLLVTDLQGREVYREEFVNDGTCMQSRQLNLSDQAGGVYLLKIKTGDKSTVKKIILQQSAE